jgi:hypothetical protein
MQMIQRAVPDASRSAKIYADVLALKDVYEMRP